MLKNLSDTVAVTALGLSLGSIIYSKVKGIDDDVKGIDDDVKELRREMQTMGTDAGRQLMKMGREYERSLQYVNKRFDAAIFSLVTKSLAT